VGVEINMLSGAGNSMVSELLDGATVRQAENARVSFP